MVRVGGVDVAYISAGNGPPLVFVHGAASDSRIWRPQIDDLADEFTVVAWDEAGCGRSSNLPADFTLDDFADCLAAVIDDIALGPAHVAGLSWGGTVAQALFHRHPSRVASLILADTYAGWKGSLPPEEVRARVRGLEQMLAGPPSAFDPTLPGLFASEPQDEVVQLMAETAADVRAETLKIELMLMAGTDLSALLPRIDVPTLLIWGEADVRSPLDVAREFERAIPGAKLILIPGAGHLSNLEAPAEFNAAVRDFCRQRSESR